MVGTRLDVPVPTLGLEARGVATGLDLAVLYVAELVELEFVNALPP